MGKSWDKGGWGETGKGEPYIYRQLRGRFGEVDDSELLTHGQTRSGDDVWPGYHAAVELFDTENGPKLRLVHGGATGDDSQSRISAEMGKRGEMPDFRVHYTGGQSEFIAAETAARIAAAARARDAAGEEDIPASQSDKKKPNQYRPAKNDGDTNDDYYENLFANLDEGAQAAAAVGGNSADLQNDPAVRRAVYRADLRERKIESRSRAKLRIGEMARGTWTLIKSIVSSRNSETKRAERVEPEIDLSNEPTAVQSSPNKDRVVFTSGPNSLRVRRAEHLRTAFYKLQNGGSYNQFLQDLERSMLTIKDLRYFQNLIAEQRQNRFQVTRQGKLLPEFNHWRLENQFGKRILLGEVISRDTEFFSQNTRSIILDKLKRKSDSLLGNRPPNNPHPDTDNYYPGVA